MQQRRAEDRGRGEAKWKTTSGFVDKGDGGVKGLYEERVCVCMYVCIVCVCVCVRRERAQGRRVRSHTQTHTVADEPKLSSADAATGSSSPSITL